MAEDLPEEIEGLPNLCGSEDRIAEALGRAAPVPSQASPLELDGLRSAFATALHMHQPLIPAGGPELRTARIISNLQDMMDHPDVGDNHNAPVFRWCYKRMGEFIPKLVEEGHEPRIMLDYSGCLLHGLWDMGLDDVFEALRALTWEPRYRGCVEWLGTAWGHAVAPSTPVQDFRLHVRAWQHHFAALFGLEALQRVQGFSPPEMALPNHPDVCFEFVRTLKECGYRWLLVQEHSVEELGGREGVRQPHLPHRLVARSSRGQTATIVAFVKTQGSDAKLVGQMQPYYEAQGLEPIERGGRRIPPLVSQVADGENGGVMMNEFPPKYLEVMAEASGSATRPLNASEHLASLEAAGITEEDLPGLQPILQQRIWERLEPGAGPEALARVIEALEAEDDRFHMEGGSWTNDVSWVQGYESLMGPMERASALFAEKALRAGVSTAEPRYRKALFHLLASQTSCFRYWGEGLWTDYGRELCRRTTEILRHDF